MDAPKSIADKSFHDPAIDGLRGLAILFVILFHALRCATREPTQVLRIPFLEKICEGGAGGVSLFFVLSALTLMISTQVRFSKDFSPRAAFYVRRAFRILPMWWLFIAVSVYLREPAEREILPHYLMYFGFMPGMKFTHVGWSLFVEETFYLFFPLIFLTLLRPLGLLLFFVMVSLLSGRFFDLSLGERLPEDLIFLSRIPFVHYVTFALGITCFHLTKTNSKIFQKLTSYFPKHLWDLLGLISFLLFLLTPAHGNYQILGCFLFVSVSMIDGTWTRQILSTKVLRTFGVCCYSIYLFHGLFLFSIRFTPWFQHLGRSPFVPDLQLFVGFILASGVSLAFGLFSFRYIEKPLIKLGKRVTHLLGFAAKHGPKEFSKQETIVFEGT